MTVMRRHHYHHQAQCLPTEKDTPTVTARTHHQTQAIKSTEIRPRAKLHALPLLVRQVKILHSGAAVESANACQLN